MNETSLRTFQQYAAGERRHRRRTRAAGVLASFALAALMVACASRRPIGPLRAVARWSLELNGARFVADGHARLQSSLNDCGPTALADLLDLTGRDVPSAASLRRLSRTTSMGTNIDDLSRAAATSGLPLFGVRWDPADLILLPLPSLVWVNKNHFVIVSRRASADSVEVHDPAAGLYRMKSERFAKLWSGEALILLDSVIPHRDENIRSGSRSHRARGTRASMKNGTEV